MYERDRREHQRHQINLPAAIFVRGQPYPCRIRDISEDGFFVTCKYFFSIGEKVFLTSRDMPPKIGKAGRTVRIDLSGIGGMFDKKEDRLQPDHEE